MNQARLFLGSVHAARIVHVLRHRGASLGFNEIKQALADDAGPTPAPSALARTLGTLIDEKVLAKTDEGRYSLTTERDFDTVSRIADLALSLEA